MSAQLPPDEAPGRAASIMNRIVAASLGQPFLVMLMTLVLIGAGAHSLRRLPVDAYPDLSPPIVEIITQWPGHTAEEVERLITVPVEIEMNGIPNSDNIRSISLYGLSDVIITFHDGAGDLPTRQEVFNRLPSVSLPTGVTPSVSPLSAPSGLIYRYVLQSPDRSPMELKTLEAWTIEPQYKSVPGVADDSGFGGGTMQYQVLLDQAKIAAVGLSPVQVEAALTANNSNAGGGFYSQGGQFYYVRGMGRMETTEDIGNVVLAVHDGTPVLLKDVGRVAIGIAPRLGEFGYEKQDDAVEGVILLRTGEKTQDVLKRVEAKTKELNDQVLPKDVKVVPFYDRTDLIALTTQVVEKNLLRGMLLVIVILIFFLYDFRAGLIVAATIPLALLFAFICLDLQNASANLLSIGAIDFGILVDGAVVMVENIFRQLAERRGTQFTVREVIKAAAAEVDRPLFYAVAVIVVSFLPIYVLSGPSGTLFRPMADTMVFALVGSLIVTLTLLPVLCAWFMRKGVQERRNRAFDAIKSVYAKGLDVSLAYPWWTTFASAILLAGSLLLIPRIGAEFMPQLDEGALWVRATMPYTISFDESAKITPRIRDVLRSFPEVTTLASELGRPDDGTDSTGFFNVEFYVGLKPYSQWNGAYRTIRISLNGDHASQNYKLAYRQGYWADDPNQPRDANKSAAVTEASAAATHSASFYALTAMARGAPTPQDILFKVRVLPASTATEDTPAPGNILDPNQPVKGPFRRYDVDYAALAAAITLLQQPDGSHKGSVEFSLRLYDRDGKLLNAMGKTVEINLNPENYARYEEAARKGAGVGAHLEISVPVKQEAYLRIGIHDLPSNRFGVVEIPVATVAHLAPPPEPTPPATPTPAPTSPTSH